MVWRLLAAHRALPPTAQGSSLVAAGLSSGTATGALTSSVASVAGAGVVLAATQGTGVLAASTAALAGTGASRGSRDRSASWRPPWRPLTGAGVPRWLAAGTLPAGLSLERT